MEIVIKGGRREERREQGKCKHEDQLSQETASDTVVVWTVPSVWGADTLNRGKPPQILVRVILLPRMFLVIEVICVKVQGYISSDKGCGVDKPPIYGAELGLR